MASLKGLSWSASTSILGALIDIFKIAILAHFLAPESFAAFAIALIVIGFSQIFSEGGIGNAVVSIADIDRRQAASVFNFSIVIAVVIYAIVLMVTPMIASFYEQPVLLDVIPLIALTIPLSSASRILQALMQRTMDMQSIALANLSAKGIGLLVAWWLAANQFDIYALVWSSLITALVLFLYALFKGGRLMEWSPVIHWQRLKPILSFSIYQLFEFLLNFFARNFDVLLLTKFLGAETTGVYVVCKNLLMQGGDIVVSTFVRYFHPWMASIQKQYDKLSTIYLCFFRSVTFSIWIAYGVIAVNAVLVTELLLGQKFENAAQLLPVMAALFVLRYSTAPVATLWLVRQKPQIGVYWNVMVALVVPAVIYMSYPAGIMAVLYSLIGSQAGFLCLSILLTYYLNHKNWSQLSTQIIWIGGLASGITMLSLASFYLETGVLVNLIASCTLAVTLVVGAWFRRELFLGSK